MYHKPPATQREGGRGGGCLHGPRWDAADVTDMPLRMDPGFVNGSGSTFRVCERPEGLLHRECR